MDYNAKRAKLSGVIYIILALMLVMIMCVTLFTLTAPKRNEAPDVPEDPPTTDTPDTPSNIGSIETDLIDAGAQPNREDTAETDAKTDDLTANTPLPEERTFSMPINGHIMNECSLDTLVYSLTMEDYRAHTGLDIECADKSEVRACSDGTIADIYNDSMWGWCITVDHGDELVSIYKGLSESFPEGIEKGVVVCEGDVIALSGDTAIIETALPSHLHFEMMCSGRYVDPFEYVPLDTPTNDYSE